MQAALKKVGAHLTGEPGATEGELANRNKPSGNGATTPRQAAKAANVATGLPATHGAGVAREIWSTMQRGDFEQLKRTGSGAGAAAAGGAAKVPGKPTAAQLLAEL
ncbi:hypothetical protein T492DRAFT_875220 [Pavlovales sp. CCMP2436]|nr:hypothetical protein T492DRAFT_875220 [Pavlovales sp. CCMP2436]